MSVLKDYFDYSQLAMAAYADLNESMNGELGRPEYLLALQRADMSPFQSNQFADIYTILDQLPDDPDSGFSATIFKKENGIDEEYILAVRGSRPLEQLFENKSSFDDVINDWINTNVGDIVSDGIAIKQAIDMFNYIQVQTAHAGETVYQYTYHAAITDPTFGFNQPAHITSEAITVTSDGELADKNFTVTGHSTGGHLAAIMSRLLPDRVDATYTYAAPGFDAFSTGTEEFFQLLHDAEVAATGSSQIITDTDGGFTSPDIPQINVIEVPGDAATIGDKPKTEIEIYSEGEGEGFGPNHSIKEISDALAIYQIFESLDNSITVEALRNISLSSTNKQNHSLELVINALGDLVIDNGDKVNFNSRDQLYRRIENIREKIFIDLDVITPVLKPEYQGLTISSLTTVIDDETVSIPSITLKLAAENSIAYRYVLKNFNPFVITGNDAIYDNDTHNPRDDDGIGLLDLVNFSNEYLTYRSQFLELKINASLSDTSGPENGAIYYEDKASRFIITEKGITKKEDIENFKDSHPNYIFGSDSSDKIDGSNAQGEGNGDHLYGGAGADDIFGGAGDDYIEGNDGNDSLIGGLGADTLNGGRGLDSYVVNNGDTIIDEKGDGLVYFRREIAPNVFEDSLAIGGVKVEGGPENTYTDASGKFTYVLDGTTLTVTQNSPVPQHTITINDFTSGDLGIHLFDELPVNETKYGTISRDNLFVTKPDDPETRVVGLGDDDDITVIIGQTPGMTIFGDSEGTEELPTDGDDRIFVRYSFETPVIDFEPETTEKGVTVFAGGGHDDVKTSYRDDFVFLGSGHDSADTYIGDDIVDGGAGNDLIEGDAGDDLLMGNADEDWLLGGEGDDNLYGGDHDDVLYGDLDVDTGFIVNNATWIFSYIQDNPGNCNPFYFDPEQPGPDQFFPLFSESNLTNAGDDQLFGGAGDDKLYGGAGKDTLDGGGDNDTLQGEGGDDKLFGGAGQDILWGDINPETYNKDTEIVQSYDYTACEDHDHIAHILFRAHADPIDVAGDDELDGGANTDLLYGGGGNDTYIFGVGYGTDISIDAEGDTDKVKIVGNISPDDVVLKAEGNDIAVFLLDENGSATDQLMISDWFGDGKIESIEFDDGTVWDEETILSKVNPPDEDDPENPEIDAYFALTDGDDAAQGQDSNDAIYSLGGNDLVQAGGGDDRVSGGSGSDTILGEAGNDHLFGGNGDDLVQGGAGNDQLSGGEGNDTLFGESGNDTLRANEGNDTLQGGNEDDIYVFNTGDGNDLIFESGDTQGDVLRFGEGINPEDILITQDGGRLVASHVNGADSVSIANWFVGSEYKFAQFEFEDGTVWDIATIEAKLPDSLLITDSHTSRGGISPSTYTLDITVPDGFNAVVEDAGGEDHIRFDRIIYNTFPFVLSRTPILEDATRQGDDLVLTVTVDDTNAIVNDPTGTVTIKDYYTESGFIETIEFPDGQILGEPNSAPEVNNPVADQIIDLDVAYNFQLPSDLFTDGLFDRITLEATLSDGSELPAWLSFNPETQTFSGIPTTGDDQLLEITVKATDSGDLTATDTFILNVGNLNQGPIAGADNFTVEEDVPKTILAADLLTNDTDPNNDNLTILAVGNAENGSVELDGNGDVVFTSDQDFNGSASFAYLVDDSNGGFDVATVNVEVTAVNDAPVANPDAATAIIGEGQANPGDDLIPGEIFIVNTDSTYLNRRTPAVTSLSNGDFVIIYNSEQNDGIYGQRYSITGEKLGEEFTVNTFPITSYIRGQDVAALDNGGYVVTWETDTDATGDDDQTVSAQIFDANNNKVGTEFRVNTETFGVQWQPKIATLTNGNFVITWWGQAQVLGDIGTFGIVAQVFDSDGNKISPEFLVNSSSTGTDQIPDVTALDTGGFVIAWGGDSLVDGQPDLHLQRFNSSGNKLGGEIIANDNLYDDIFESTPAITGLPGGGFVVAWQNDNGYEDIYIQRFDANGNKLGSNFTLPNPNFVYMAEPGITTLQDGSFIVTASVIGPDNDYYTTIVGQRYDAQGNLVGELLYISPPNDGFEEVSSNINALDDGGFSAAWINSWTGDINARVYNDPSSLVSAGSFLIDVLANDTDIDDDSSVFTLDNVSLQGELGSVSIVGNQIKFDAGTDFDFLGENDSATVFIDYTMSDDDGLPSSSTLTLTVAKSHAPVANPDAVNLFLDIDAVDPADNILSVDVLANDTDVDPGDDPATFTLDSVTLQGNLGQVSIVDNQLIFDPGSDFNFLTEGETTNIIIDYTMSDDSGKSASSTATITVMNNQPPQANPDTATLILPEGAGDTFISVDVLANDVDPDASDNAANFTLETVTLQGDLGEASIVDNKLFFDADNEFDFLEDGEFATVNLDYTMSDDSGVTSTSKISINVRTAANIAPVAEQDFATLPIKTIIANDEFLITSNGDVWTRPSIAKLTNGNFIVVWGDSNTREVKGQLLDATGNEVIQEYTIANYLGFDAPDVTALAGGGFAVTWTGPGGVANPGNIKVQIYDQDGVATGSVITANFEQFNSWPRITGTTDGGFVVVWEDFSSQQQGGQRFDANGNPVVTDRIVSEFNTDVAALSDGGFYVVSVDNNNTLDIFGQKYDVNGNRLGSVNISTTIGETFTHDPRVTMLANDRIVVTWTDDDDINEGKEIYAQLLSVSGTKIGNPILVNSFVDGDEEFSSVTALADGGFVVAWKTDSMINGDYIQRIAAQRFDNNGSTVGNEFIINSTIDPNNGSILPDLVAADDGSLFAVWQSFNPDLEPSNYAIAGRIFSFDDEGEIDNSITLDVLANDVDIDPDDNVSSFTLESVTLQGNKGTVSIIDNKLVFDPGEDFNDLGLGEIETVIVDYTMADDEGLTSSSTVTITVHDQFTTPGTDGDDVITVDDEIPGTNTLGGNDIVTVITATNDAVVNTGSGNNTINVNSGSNTIVNTGDGNNTFNVTFSSPSTTSIATGNGSNIYNFTFPTFGDPLIGLATATVSGGSGPNSYAVNNYLGSNTSASISINNRSSGANSIFLGNSISSNVNLSLGSLQINFDNSDLVIHLENFDPNDVLNGPRDIDFFEFEDGLVLTYEEFVSRGFDIEGTENDDNLTGTNITDRINGLGGNDVINSGDGDDILTGGTGNDTLQGGAGDDVYVYSLGDGHDVITDSSGINQLLFNAGINSSDIDVDQLGDDLVIEINENDKITITDWFIDEDNQIDRITFNEDGPVFFTNEQFEGLLNQQPVVDAGIDDQITSEDTLFNFTIPVNAFNDPDIDDSLTYDAFLTDGSELPDWLIFDPDTQTFNGIPPLDASGEYNIEVTVTDTHGASVSDIFTLKVLNTVNGDDTNNRLIGTDEDDSINGLDKNDRLYGRAGNDILNGGDKNDRLYGGDGDDQLFGNAGNDRLFGGSGDDILSGGTGNDRLIGGSGSDVYQISSNWGHDKINNYDTSENKTDSIVFEDDLNPLDLVFTQNGDDLIISQVGENNKLVINDWYDSSEHQTEIIEASNGSSLAYTQVDQLIQAMAAFSADTGLDWSTAAQQHPEEVQAILATAWQ